MATDSAVGHLPSGHLTVHLIASGVLAVSEQRLQGRPLSVPYPPSLQRGLNRLVLAGIRQDMRPVQHVPELLAWCEQPLAHWPLALAAQAVGPADTLLLDGKPTAICQEWASTVPDVEADLEEQALIYTVLDICRAQQAPALYSAFRRYLIAHPVQTELELQQARVRGDLLPLGDQVLAAYAEAPPNAAENGAFQICAACGDLRLRTSAGGLRCDDRDCPGNIQAPGRTLPAAVGVRWQKRGIRRYVTIPGRSELRLAGALEVLGLTVELWPAFDAYDVRVTFRDGTSWALDVKDWANPYLLAQDVHAVKPFPSWTRAYFVIPAARLAARPDYLRAFRNHCPILTRKPWVDVIAEQALIRAARRYQKEHSYA